MKKTMIALCLSAGMLIATGCNDRVTMDDPIESEQTRDDSIIPLDSALKSVESLYKRIYNTPDTRSARKVKSISYFGDIQATRTDGDNPLYYVINYDNDEGFAVVGAREGYDGVYAISDSGQLSISDTTDNPGLAIFFDLLPTSPRPSSRFPHTGDPGGPDSTLLDKPIDIYWEKDYSDSVPPILTHAIRAWHQRSPYNFYCNEINGQKAVAGCVPVAVGMLMSAYETPKSYKGHTYNWKMMKGNWLDAAVKQYGTARLIADLGAPENFNTNYGLTTSSTTTEKYYKRVFQNFGYNTPPNFRNFSSYDVSKMIKSTGKPVLMRGKHKNTGKGHAWVCDGYIYECIETTWGTLGNGFLLHMVWGNESSEYDRTLSGYFKIGDEIIPFKDYNLTSDQRNWNEEIQEEIQYSMEITFIGGITTK